MPACSEGAVVKESITDLEQNENGTHRPSQLFLVRVWIERINKSDKPEDLAGKVQDPVSGQVQYFSGGMQLVRILFRLMRKEVHRPGEHPEDGHL
jgi:hypothetical protein